MPDDMPYGYRSGDGHPSYRGGSGGPEFHHMNTRSLVLMLTITAMLSIALSVTFTCIYVGKVLLNSAAFQAQGTGLSASSGSNTGGQCTCFITSSRYGSEWAGGCCTPEDTSTIYDVVRQNVADYINNPTPDSQWQSQGSSTETVVKPMAHLTGIPQSIETVGTETESTIRDWESENGVAYTLQIAFDGEGHLEVQQGGYYYVYSQVTFSQDTGPRATDEPLSFTDQLARNQLIHVTRKIGTFGDDRDLMWSARSKTWSEDQVYGLYTSYHGGIFLLQQGDRVAVKISTASSEFLSLEESKSYFGMFLVS